MSRETKMTIGAINIKIHPHSPEKYIELFTDVIKLKKKAAIRGDIYGSLSKFNYIDSNKLNGFKGYIFKFLNVNPDEPWFDVEQEKAADSRMIQEVEVLKKIKPHFSFFMYYFFPKKHRFIFTSYYDQKSISPNSVARFLENLFYEPEIIEKYGEVDVIVEPSVEGLEKIFAITTIERLELVITKPNPDDHEDAEQKLLKRLGKLKAKQLREEYVSERRESIVPDNELKILSKIAASNGYVIASGRNLEGRPVRESTIEHPFLDPVYYRNDEDPNAVFIAGAKDALDKVT
jgi:hypothetical protein